MKIVLPPNFNRRYTLDFLVPKKALESGKTILSIEKDVADIMGRTTRMVRKYRTEPKDSKRKELSAEVLGDLGTYFGVDPEQLITNNVLDLSKDIPLAQEAAN